MNSRNSSRYNPSICLRPANPDDVALLKYWDTKPHVIAAGGDDDWFVWEEELSRKTGWQEFFIAEKTPARSEEFILSTRRVKTHYWGKVAQNQRAIDIWIGEETDLGQGYGTQMMKLTFEHCFGDTVVSAILIDPLTSNTSAHKFYKRLGFQKQEERRFGSDECTVFQLTRAHWQQNK
ncbi:MAG: GNAT family N-acetyltransferase [Devosiaceae bacterium]|nr:GNAT family N-acetyltransferase [Devosiaceae bacterium]